MSTDQTVEADERAILVTVRDLLRYAVTRFSREGVVFGHGAANALDEAAFLILETLALPVDDVNPWLEARLLPQERRDVLARIDARVSTRQPAPYLVGKAYQRGFAFKSDARAIVPRSYLADILLDGTLDTMGVARAAPPTRILDLCCGAGPLAIIAASLFPDAAIDAVDLSAEALSLARENVAAHDLADRIALIEGDLFAPLQGRRYDLILANPPYVARAEVDAFPPEYAAEPRLAHEGGADGFDLVRRILAGIGEHLTESGGLLCEIGTGAEILEAEFPALPFLWLDADDAPGEVFWLPASALGGRKRGARLSVIRPN